VGKSTFVEEFARNEYDSYVLIDFSLATADLSDRIAWFQHMQSPALGAENALFDPIMNKTLSDAEWLGEIAINQRGLVLLWTE